jgi:predicted dehydrogenase
MNLPDPMPELPRVKRPIYVVGAGGIVRDAHLPAYNLAGFDVAGITDVNIDRAKQTAAEFGVGQAFDDLPAMVSAAPPEAVYDVAVPASAVLGVLKRLPDGAAVLIQKPLGEDLAQARAIRDVCRSKSLQAAVNFQLRWAPYIARARELIAAGAIGTLHDIEVRVTVFMPWQLWTFLEQAPRVEIVYHSIHYVDLIRSFAGEPTRVHALTLRHPAAPKLHSTRTSIAMDYGDAVRATITTNHGHIFGLDEQESYVKWEGTKGAIKARLGLLMNYPQGEPDQLKRCTLDAAGKPEGWRDVPFTGSWYPHAFIGSMASLQRFAEGSSSELPTRVDDAFKTMAVVEAAYEDSERGGVAVPT